MKPDALQPPSLDAGPVAHKFHVVILIAYGEPYIVSAVVRPGFEEHRALWRLDAPAEFQRFFQCRLIRRTRKPCRLGVEMYGEIGVLRHLADIRIFREHGHPAFDKGAIARRRYF